MSEKIESETPVGQPRIVRGCLITKSEGTYVEGYRTWQEPAVFHAWTKYPRCAIGDGSMIDWVTLAIIEWPDGKVDLCEPCQIQFSSANKQITNPRQGTD